MIQGPTLSPNIERASQDQDDRTVVLMATYNGAPFLDEQLRSLREQTETNWILVVRDDHSNDRTKNILTSFALACKPGQVVLMPSGPQRLGVLGDFLTLLAHAPIGARYAFCDQDDVWLPNKLTRAVRAFRGYPSNTPVLYCSRQVIVDETLRRLRLSSDMPRPPSLRNALVQNLATGNTVVINDSARRAILAAPAPADSFHDWWSYLVVVATGGSVIYDANPTILYRNHGKNIVGSPPGAWARLKRAVSRGYSPFMYLFFKQVHALLEHPGLTIEAHALLKNFAFRPNERAVAKMVRLYGGDLYRQGYLEDLALKLWFFLYCLREGNGDGLTKLRPPE